MMNSNTKGTESLNLFAMAKNIRVITREQYDRLSRIPGVLSPGLPHSNPSECVKLTDGSVYRFYDRPCWDGDMMVMARELLCA
jgi:hypothetical protein